MTRDEENEMTMQSTEQRSEVGGQTSVRPFYWSVWREFWENQSIYIAPLIVATVVLFGFLVSTIGLPHPLLPASLSPYSKEPKPIVENRTPG